MKNYPLIFAAIDGEFDEALRQLQSDPLFQSDQEIYTTDDKNRIRAHWSKILPPCKKLKKIIQSTYWRSFFTFGSKNSFVIQYVGVLHYYRMIMEIQQSFGRHEEFIRQYLDDTFSENYSTLARFMYRARFYSTLSYPHEFFLALRDDVHETLLPLFDHQTPDIPSMRSRWEHDRTNIWYYTRYRISLLLSWISCHAGREMARIRVYGRRKQGLITPQNLSKIQTMIEPGDILLTRQNWVATNLNIPGFWKHMSMYAGTGAYLMSSHRDAIGGTELDPSEHYIIEAIGTGVQLIPLSHLTEHNDYMSVIRPRFSSAKIQSAIQKTLLLIGREYDYSFNFYSDNEYVCSTLVTKSYLPESCDAEGLHIDLVRIATGITYPPNNLIKKMKHDCICGTEELDFIAFIDSRESDKSNFFGDRSAFMYSGDRPRLSFFLP